MVSAPATVSPACPVRAAAKAEGKHPAADPPLHRALLIDCVPAPCLAPKTREIPNTQTKSVLPAEVWKSLVCEEISRELEASRGEAGAHP